jgi:hypothetical protein
MRIRETVTGGFATEIRRSNYSRPDCTSPWAFTTFGGSQYLGTEIVKKIEDVLTPGFHSLLHCGGFLPLNPVKIVTTTTTRKASVEPGLVQGGFSGGCYTNKTEGPSWGLLTPRATVLPGYDDNIIGSVANTAISQCKEAVFDALTQLAEMGETVDLIATMVNRFYGLARRIGRAAKRESIRRWRRYKNRKSRRRRRRREYDSEADAGYDSADKISFLPWTGKDIPGIFADMWLEARYGWLPFIYGIQDALASINSKLKDGDLVRGRGKASESLNASGTNSLNLTTQDIYYTDIIEGSRTYRAVAFAKLDISSKHKFRIDPIITGWERIPFSFFIDWFLDIGNWLQSWSPFTGASLLGVTVSVKDDYTLKQSYVQIFKDAYAGEVNNPDATVEHVESYERFPSGPSILPNWNPRLTPARIIDFIALVFAGEKSVRRAMR